MKGFSFVFNGKKGDYAPCIFCKHRGELTVGTHCYSCIDNMDLATHKPNSETEYANFEPRSEEHLKVLREEQKNEKL